MRKIAAILPVILLVVLLAACDEDEKVPTISQREIAHEQNRSLAVQSVRTYGECESEELSEGFNVLANLNDKLDITVKPFASDTALREMTITFPDGTKKVYTESEKHNIFHPNDESMSQIDEERGSEVVQLTETGLTFAYFAVGGSSNELCASLNYARSDNVNFSFVGNWNSGDVCNESENPHKWEVSLMKLTETDVVGTINFHKCPGGGSVAYLVTGMAVNGQDYIQLEGKIAGGGGDLYGTVSSAEFETFQFTPGQPPLPNFAP